mgnify:CR=1 FL=1
MSKILLPLALDYEGDLTGSEKLVLIILCNLSNDGKGNYAWPSHKYISRKSCLSEATVKRACKSLKEKGFITWIKGKYVDGKFKTNHYRINHSSLRAVVKCNQVSKRAIEKGHPDTSDSVTMSDNNLTNNLTNNLDTSLKEKENNLSGPQVAMAKNLADKYFKIYSKEHYGWKQLYKAILNFFLSKQTEDDWLKGGLGLPSPREKGWL